MSRSLVCLFALVLMPALFVRAADKKEKPKLQMSDDEKKLLELTNQERARAKLPPLKPNLILFKVARAHSANMVKKGDMNHVLDGKNPAQRVLAAGYDYRSVAENIGFGEKDAPLPKIMKGWMESKLHRENLLNRKYREVGLGIARDKNGDAYYTQVFGTRKGAR